MTRSRTFVIDLAVRDYECDIEGIVNNAVYLNYFEHARHEYLKTSGLSFFDLHTRGFDPVVSRIEVDYRRALVSGDQFRVHTGVRRKGHIRYLFDQKIVKTSDNEVAAEALVVAVFTSEGRPVALPDELNDILDRFGAGADET